MQIYIDVQLTKEQASLLHGAEQVWGNCPGKQVWKVIAPPHPHPHVWSLNPKNLFLKPALSSTS